MKIIDPIEVTLETKRKVCNGEKYFYLDFSCVPLGNDFVSQGFAPGCNLNCIFCWSRTRTFLDPAEKWNYIQPAVYKDIKRQARYYSPEEAVEIMINNAKSRYVSKLEKPVLYLKQKRKIKILTIGGNEPIIGFEHIFRILSLINKKKEGYIFKLQTNGILLGYDKSYISELSKYKKVLIIGISIKAGSEEGFQKRTRAMGKYFVYPFKAIEYCENNGINYKVVTMSDKRLMPEDERDILFKKIRDSGYSRKIYQEHYIPFFASQLRMEKYKNDFKELSNLDWRLSLR